ncbi:MAG: heme-binding protein [Vulcanimicrobiaceae bacterium]
MTGLAGGLPIQLACATIGAVGISSGTSEQDLEVARAGIDALLGR